MITSKPDEARSMDSQKVKSIVDVSVIMPVYNAEKWLETSLRSVSEQMFSGTFEVSVYNDASKDSSVSIIDKWSKVLHEKGTEVLVNGHDSDAPRGVGYAKNMAVRHSSGKYLCFFDADDVMLAGRLEEQFQMALCNPDAIVGSQFDRLPESSTARYTQWANKLTESQLYTQMYTSHGPTVIMPTWFCSRKVFNKVEGFDESGKGTPEDLIFFYKHLRLGGRLARVDKCLLTYRYHEDAATFSIHQNTIWNIRIKAIQLNIVDGWDSFTIWNAGRQGRRFYKSLTVANRKKVLAFCDVDQKKISLGYYTYEESKQKPKPKVPIVHFSDAVAPFIICMKLDLTGGNFESNLQSLRLTEGQDYFHFN